MGNYLATQEKLENAAGEKSGRRGRNFADTGKGCRRHGFISGVRETDSLFYLKIGRTLLLRKHGSHAKMSHKKYRAFGSSGAFKSALRVETTPPKSGT